MAKVVTKSSSNRRSRNNRRSLQHQSKSKKSPPTETKTPKDIKKEKCRKAVITLSVLFLIAGVLIVLIPFFVASNGVPAALPIVGVICLLTSVILPVCCLCRRRLTRSCYDHEDSHPIRDPESGLTDGKYAQDAGNISFDSEMQADGCLQTTPRIFRFSNKKSSSTNQRPKYNSNSIPMNRPNKFENYQRNGGNIKNISGKATHQEKTNFGFISEENIEYENQCKPDPTKSLNDTRESVMSAKNINTSFQNESFDTDPIDVVDFRHYEHQIIDGYFTKEVDVDADINENISIRSYNSNVSVDIDKEEYNQDCRIVEDLQQNKSSFISPKMISSFQNHDKTKHKRHQKETKKNKNIFGFQKSQTSSKSKHRNIPIKIKGRDNPINVIDDIDDLSPSTPSVILTPPTPSPEITKLASNNFIVEVEKASTQKEAKSPMHSKQILPPGKFSNHGRQGSNNAMNKNKTDLSVNKSKKQKRSKSTSSKSTSKSEAKLPDLLPLFQAKSDSKFGENVPTDSETSPRNSIPNDIIFFEKSDDEDALDDVVVLAEAVIAPVEDLKPSSSNGDQRKFKRKIENFDEQLVQSSANNNKTFSTLFKAFSNNNKKKRKNSKNSKQSKDDMMLTENTVKDSYITGNYGSSQASGEDENNDEYSPPLVHFKNIAPDPDLAGIKFKDMRERKKFQAKDDNDSNDEEETSNFSDILKYVKKDDKSKSKIKKKKVIKAQNSTRSKGYQPPKSRSIDEINKMLTNMADNKSSDSSIPSLPVVDQKLLESSLFVNFNPGGRLNRRHGSMESMESRSSSVMSGSSYTGSTGSAGSIMNPLRSSMKKPKNKELASTISASSNQSKKSVRIAVGAEQTSV